MNTDSIITRLNQYSAALTRLSASFPELTHVAENETEQPYFQAHRYGLEILIECRTTAAEKDIREVHYEVLTSNGWTRTWVGEPFDPGPGKYETCVSFQQGTITLKIYYYIDEPTAA